MPSLPSWNSSVIQGFFARPFGEHSPLPQGRGGIHREIRRFPAVEAFQVQIFQKAGGVPLPANIQAKMESALHADFSDVRIHVGAEASSIGALAFTWGSNIHFAPGRYNPHTLDGLSLLGHELAHVIQQRSGRVANPFGRSLAVVRDRALEAEADRLGRHAAHHRIPEAAPGPDRVSNGGRAFPATGVVFRKAAQTGIGNARDLAQPVTQQDRVQAATKRLKQTVAQRFCAPPRIPVRNIRSDARSIQRSTAPTPKGAFGIIQRTAAQDSADALANINYLNNFGFPGLIVDAQNFRNDVQAEVVAYALANPLAPHPGAMHDLSISAEGLKRFTERMIESVDGGWAEVGEAHRLYSKVNSVQYPRLGLPGVNPDISYQKPGGLTGVEVKSVNSANVGQVNTQILNADAQLGNFVLNRSKVHVWIAHAQNQWPGVVGWGGRVTDAALRIAVRNQLNGMAINNADQITVLDVNVNYDGGRKDIVAEDIGHTWQVRVL